MATLKDGGFLLLAKADDTKALVQSPRSPRPTLMTREELEAAWDGRLVLMTRRAALVDLTRRFDISWFLGAIHKYRRILAEVLIASFFLQAFALVSPLFFQVVVDKVLVHRTLSTLDVLVVGLVGVGLFETILGVLRTYVFAHTTTRIDVELGARLFRHLLALPIAYFQARRVGDSVARVRELENIRNFLTSSALTVVIDLVFTVVFLAVMFLYSPLLTCVVLGSFPLYIAISAGAAPLFRQRLNEKFARGAENQAFLVESVTGVETLKAMAVEPQMQRKWEDQLAGYVGAAFRVTRLANIASESVQLVNKLVIAGTLYFGAKLVIDGDLTVGALIAFNMLAGRVSAPVLRLAQIWQDFHQARISVARLGDILNTATEPTYNPGRAALPAIRGDITFEHVSFRYRLDGPQVLHDISLRVPKGQVVGIVGDGSRHGRHRLAAPPDRRGAAGERSVQSLGAGKHCACKPRCSHGAGGAGEPYGAGRRQHRHHPRCQQQHHAKQCEREQPAILGPFSVARLSEEAGRARPRSEIRVGAPGFRTRYGELATVADARVRSIRATTEANPVTVTACPGTRAPRRR